MEKELSKLVLELKKCSETVASISAKLETLAATKVEVVKPAEKPLTLEEVRKVLADKARAGQTAAVKELLVKHGGNRLSAIKPSEFAALKAEAEAL